MNDINSSNPLISIIIPVYNIEKYLEKCLDSVKAQTYANLEILLIDDGSTDGSKDICDRYSAEDKRFVTIHQENGGASAARNKALDIAKGDLIGFVDGDDWIEPDMYENLVSLMNEHNADIVCCSFKWVSENRTTDNSTDKLTIFEGIEMFNAYISGSNGCLLSPAVWNRLFKRHIFDGIRFTEGRMFEDKEISAKTLIRAQKGVYYNHAYYNYRQHSQSISHSGVNNKSVDDFIYMSHIQNDLVKKYLKSEVYLKHIGVHYCLLLDDFCKVYKNKENKTAKEMLMHEISYIKDDAVKAIKMKTNIPKKDRHLLCLGAKHPALYYYLIKIIK